MIDIHCHLLYGVDDGAKTIEDSIALIVEAKRQGIDKIIMTPHYRHGMFAYDKSLILNNFETLKTVALAKEVELYLGCEYHVNSYMVENFDNKRVLTMADSNYILTEYKEDSEASYIKNNSIDAISAGYIPILAHVERYKCMVKHPEYASELQRYGAMIQINADAIIGNHGWLIKKYCDKLLKNKWVDFVGSDTHDLKERACHMKQAYDYVAKKYGEGYATKIFESNAEVILETVVQKEEIEPTIIPKEIDEDEMTFISFDI